MKLHLCLLVCLTLISCSPSEQQEEVISKQNTYSLSVKSTSNSNSIKQSQQSHNWWDSTSIYQIWIRSFYDSNNDGNGDIKGITEKLTYIKSLGVEAILLSPIFETPSYHGYDVIDYFEVNSDFGTTTNLKELLDKAELNNIKIILDLPINHTSDQHPWFLQTQKYPEYYAWSQDLPQEQGLPWSDVAAPQKVWHSKENKVGWYYGVFGYSNPDLNYHNPIVKKELKKVLKHWIGQGVDGFRIDAARYLVEEPGTTGQADTIANHSWIVEFIQFAKQLNPEVFFVGETYADINTSKAYLTEAGGFDAIFNFEFSGNILGLYENVSEQQFSHYDHVSVIKHGINQLYELIINNTPKNKQNIIFLSNHDVNRFISPTPNSHLTNKILATLTILSPFNTVTYYGEEVGVEQKLFNDDVYRRSLMHWGNGLNGKFNNGARPWVDDSAWFPWLVDFEPWNSSMAKYVLNNNVEEQQHKSSLLQHYKNLLHLKQNDIVFSSNNKIFTSSVAIDNAFVGHFKSGEISRMVFVNLNPFEDVIVTIPDNLKGSYQELLSQSNIELSETLQLSAGESIVLARQLNIKN